MLSLNKPGMKSSRSTQGTHASADRLSLGTQLTPFASDDRNAGTVSQRIKNALDAGSGLRSKGKPTCVVIDEIDGSAGGDMVSRAGLIRMAHIGRD